VQAFGAALGEAREAAARALGQPRAAIPAGLVVALAEARLGGVQRPEVDRVLAAAQHAKLGAPGATRAAAALSDLVARGFSPAASSRAVVIVLDRGAPGEALEQLGPSAERRQRDSGASADDALDDAAHGSDHGEHDPNPHSAADDHGPNRDTSGQRGPHGKGKN
jgi:hypothetical protein